MNAAPFFACLSLAVIALFPSRDAQAQMGRQTTATAVEPAQDLPPVPQASALLVPTPSQSVIPPLPVSSPCKPEDVYGLWKVRNIYEEPAGQQAGFFAQMPHQYLFLRLDGTYGRFNNNQMNGPKFVMNQIKNNASNLLQFLVQDKGLMYFYQDRVASDVQSCFIVAQPQDKFLQGDMLLMPPKGQIQGRLIKQYARIWAPPRVRQEQNQQNRQNQQGQPGQNRHQLPNYIEPPKRNR